MKRPEPWERQPKESSPAWEAFVTYRDMGADRSYRKVAELLGKNPSGPAHWCEKHLWVSRAAAWDAEQDRLHRKALQKQAKQATERHAKIAQQLNAKVVERLMAMGAKPGKDGAPPTPPEHVSLRDLAKWFEVGVKVERLSLGLSSEKVEQTTGDAAGGPPPMDVDIAALLADPDVRLAVDRFLARQGGLAGDAGVAGRGPEPTAPGPGDEGDNPPG